MDNPRWCVAHWHIIRINVDFWACYLIIKPAAAIEEAARPGDLRVSVSGWQQSSFGVFCGKHDHIILIKSPTMADFISNHTLPFFFEAKPSDLCWTTSSNIRIGIYSLTYLWLQEDHWVQTQMKPSLDCWPTSSRTGRRRKKRCQWWPDIRKTYFNLQQPLAGAALLSFGWVGIRAQLNPQIIQ